MKILDWFILKTKTIKIKNDSESLKLFKKIFENLNESFRTFLTKFNKNLKKLQWLLNLYSINKNWFIFVSD